MDAPEPVDARTFSLAAVNTRSTPGFEGDKAAGEALLKAERKELGELQERLFAESRYGGRQRVLLVVQAMDTAGKGGILRHVIGGVDPQGISIAAFKKPTEEELAHHFLWRVERRLPEPGMIGVFDRSHYEDVLIHRVRGLSPAEVIEERYGLIRDFEQELLDDGIVPIKVMLHISKEAQRARLLERIERPDKHWKYNPGDVDERARWDDYMTAYRIAIARTDRDEAPWYVVPADRKWYARLAVQQLLLDALRSLQLDWPAADFDPATERRRLAAS